MTYIYSPAPTNNLNLIVKFFYDKKALNAQAAIKLTPSDLLSFGILLNTEQILKLNDVYPFLIITKDNAFWLDEALLSEYLTQKQNYAKAVRNWMIIGMILAVLIGILMEVAR